MKTNFKGQNVSENEPQIEEKLSALLQVTAKVLKALKSEAFEDVDRAIVETLQSQLQEIALAEAARFGLTARETEVWQLWRDGVAYKEIAAVLMISVNTVKRHFQSIHSKMGL